MENFLRQIMEIFITQEHSESANLRQAQIDSHNVTDDLEFDLSRSTDFLQPLTDCFSDQTPPSHQIWW